MKFTIKSTDTEVLLKQCNLKNAISPGALDVLQETIYCIRNLGGKWAWDFNSVKDGFILFQDLIFDNAISAYYNRDDFINDHDMIEAMCEACEILLKLAWGLKSWRRRPLIYAAYTDRNGEQQSRVFTAYADYYGATLGAELDTCIEFSFAPGTYKDYAARQDHARDLAIRFQSEQRPGLSLGELAAIEDFFYTVGRRYGLLREFRENCIC